MASSLTEHDESGRLKREIRRAAHAARRVQPHKDRVSKQITDAVVDLAIYRHADCVMWYVDVRDEVRTRQVLADQIASGKQIVVPYCVDDQLELFRLESMEELVEGMYGVLEPKAELRGRPDKVASVDQLRLILVPGVAFDREGGRLGHGKGYYDRLLQNVRPDTLLVSLAFECQVFDKIPMQPHDVPMDLVVTQCKVYEGRGRGG
ncbi:5-formyltetrahydrofolate cyclo-ligase [Aporhodopirellula aestuarii]|uniref:5-formyltetrahydrofolate cyclo-ligase n=1 Tax=Aporhodopirellula aestuarii TaxID=2950107 RepID=A0ABT0U0L0_9BACT|nr:5-formyltetrahydrofolate cyclo-ligase [Aporhodopirellula aestuarii]MCM2370423.1 5-formyltetrahydrofolate cyclo-ligase [Aporhodopirellula aestuarii]